MPWARVMGGPGSGEWPRTNVNRSTDSVPKLSVTALLQAVNLEYAGNTGRASWKFHGQVVAAFYLLFDGARVWFRSEPGGWSIDEERSGQSIEFASTSCYFGGKRKWFICPNCDKRVAVLYLTAQRWSCRKCGRIRYSSQQESKDARLTRRLSKARRRLGASSNLWAPPGKRPKGMHWKTFINLLNLERQLRTEWLQRVAAIERAGNPYHENLYK